MQRNSNTFSDPNRDSYRDGDSYTDSHSNGYGEYNTNNNAYIYAHSHGYSHSDSELDAQADSYAEISAHAPTAPIVKADFPLAVGPTIKKARIQPDTVLKK